MRCFIGAAIVALSVTGLAAGSPAPPSLQLVDSDPATFIGRGFKPGERVTIMLVDHDAPPAKAIRRATRIGAFGVMFGSVTVDRCEAVFVRATGLRGSRAAYKKLPGPACVVQRTD
jgi:hypothetical protein